MDDVTLATEVFSLELDRLDPFEMPYNLNVSSPGSERPLFSKRHFERFHDLKAKVKVGQEQFKGIIRNVTDETVTFEVGKELKTYTLGLVEARLDEWPDTPR
jgi:ribosome maturation factor RimP